METRRAVVSSYFVPPRGDSHIFFVVARASLGVSSTIDSFK